MKLLIVHLSDIHLKTSGNSILTKKEQISKAFQNLCVGVDNLFLVVSGDIAYSGKEEEYLQAIELLEGIKENIERYTNHKLNFVIIPGNHDCDHDYDLKKIKIRETIIESIYKNPNEAISEAFIDQCCEVQNAWFEFLKIYQDSSKVLQQDKLFEVR